MGASRLARRLVPFAAATALVAIPIAHAATTAAPTIGPAGVGKVKLGKTYKRLRAQHLIGKIRKGCELAPNTRSAKLRAPLKGLVNFTLTSPRKVDNILIRGGATARGVGIGATIAEIQAAFPKAVVDHRTEGTFKLTLIKIPRSDGGRLQFAVSVKTGKVTLIGVPFIAFCE